MSKETTRKLKIKGQRKLIDPETGEEIDVGYLEVGAKDFNFSKLWIANILEAAQTLSNAKMNIVFHLLKKVEESRGTNALYMTVRDIADETKHSTQTVTRTLKVLEECDVIRRRVGVIFMNPEVIYKGSHGSRMNVLITYKSVENKAAEEAKTISRAETLKIKMDELSEYYQQLERELSKVLQEEINDKTDELNSTLSKVA